MRTKLPENLKAAVRAYYVWHHDRKPCAIQFVRNADGDRMVLAHFVDGSTGERCSSLMFATGWADGHWDVSEAYTFGREDEKEALAAFRRTSLEEFDREWLDLPEDDYGDDDDTEEY